METNAQQVQVVAAPPAAPATKMAVLASATDVAVYFGQTRVAFDTAGAVVAQQVEYTSGVILSPTTAKQLQLMLSQTMDEYEKRFGKIPMDPEFNKESLLKTVEQPKA
jgi:hypothetical protein